MSQSNGNGTANNPSTAPSSDIIQIDVGDFLRRRKGLLLLGGLIGGILAAMYCLTTPTIFESNTKILVIPKDSKLTTSSNAEFGFESTVGDELLATHMQIIGSPRVISDALGTNDLFSLASLTAEVADPTLDQQERRRGIVRYVRENLSVRRGGDGASRDAQVLDVTFKHTSDVDCSEILSAVVTSYQNFLGEKIKGAGDEAAALILEASEVHGKRLAEQDKKLKDSVQKSPDLLWADVNLQPIKVNQLQTELANLQIKRAEVESRLELTRKTLARGESGDISPLEKLTVLDKDDIDRVALLVQLEKGYPNSERFESIRPALAEAANVEYQELMSLRVQAKQDELKYGKNHPKAVATREKITELQRFLDQRTTDQQHSPKDLVESGIELDRLVRVYERLLSNDLDDLKSRESELLSLIAEEKKIATTVALEQVDLTNLQRERDRTQGLYDAVIDRLGEINLLKDYGGFITDVISPVEIGQKSWPSIPVVGLMGLMLGSLAGAGVAIAAELADKSFRNPKDVEHELGVPILAHVNVFDQSKVNVSPDSSLENSLVTFHAPRSRYSEAFRTLRTSVFFRTKSLQSPVVQVTSPNAGDGKSTVASNLAISIAQAGKSVLLVDCDMRRPMLAKLFGVKHDSGLSEILTGKANMDEATSRCGEVSNLSLIPCGSIPENPAELLALPDFSDLVAKARQEFDFIILDSPPVSPVADPLTIASIADFVILGMTLRKNSRTIAARTRNELTNNGAELLGLVINRTAEETNRYGYSYGGYDNSSRYGGTYRYGGRYETQAANEAYYG